MHVFGYYVCVKLLNIGKSEVSRSFKEKLFLQFWNYTFTVYTQHKQQVPNKTEEMQFLEKMQQCLGETSKTYIFSGHVR